MSSQIHCRIFTDFPNPPGFTKISRLTQAAALQVQLQVRGDLCGTTFSRNQQNQRTTLCSLLRLSPFEFSRKPKATLVTRTCNLEENAPRTEEGRCGMHFPPFLLAKERGKLLCADPISPSSKNARGKWQSQRGLPLPCRGTWKCRIRILQEIIRRDRSNRFPAKLFPLLAQDATRTPKIGKT